jgi:hypothetical protein
VAARRIVDQEIAVLGVAVEERLDERADRDHAQAAAANVFEGTGDERRAKPAPAEMRVDLGMQQRDHAFAAIAVDELAGRVACDEQDVPALVGAVLDGQVLCGQALRLPPVRLAR